MITVRKILLSMGLVTAGLPVLVMAGVVFLVGYFDVSSGSVISSGEEREYLVHVPASVDGRHTRPGVPRMPASVAGKTTTSIHASRVMWAFFSRYELGTAP